MFGDTLRAQTAKGQTQAQADISAQEIAARLQSARISADAAVSRGERTTLDEEVYKQLISEGKTPTQAYEFIQKLKKPPDWQAQLMQGIGGVGGPPPGAVRPK